MKIGPSKQQTSSQMMCSSFPPPSAHRGKWEICLSRHIAKKLQVLVKNTAKPAKHTHTQSPLTVKCSAGPRFRLCNQRAEIRTSRSQNGLMVQGTQLLYLGFSSSCPQLLKDFLQNSFFLLSYVIFLHPALVSFFPSLKLLVMLGVLVSTGLGFIFFLVAVFCHVLHLVWEMKQISETAI